MARAEAVESGDDLAMWKSSEGDLPPGPGPVGGDRPIRANLDLVRAAFADWERGDHSNVDWAHPEIEFVIADGPAPGGWVGLAGMAQGFGDYIDVWEDARLGSVGFRELDDDRILALVHRVGRGKTSGLDGAELLDTDGAILLHLRDGRVPRLVLYWDRELAFADLGLGPEGG
jgi:ketosteroid isomerase-like protein